MPTQIKLRLDGFNEAPKVFKQNVGKYKEQVTVSTQQVARRVASDIEVEGRADIAAGGNFSSARWQNGLRALVSFETRQRLNIRVTHSVFYWRVFEFGARILGKPMLWIPLSFAKDAQKVRARDYPGKLFRVNRKNGKAPLLMTKRGDKAEAKYFGKPSVTIPKKWHLKRVIYNASRRMNRYFKEAMRANKNG